MRLQFMIDTNDECFRCKKGAYHPYGQDGYVIEIWEGPRRYETEER
jgi:hypothetical protein